MIVLRAARGPQQSFRLILMGGRGLVIEECEELEQTLDFAVKGAEPLYERRSPWRAD